MTREECSCAHFFLSTMQIFSLSSENPARASKSFSLVGDSCMREEWGARLKIGKRYVQALCGFVLYVCISRYEEELSNDTLEVDSTKDVSARRT